MGMMHHSRRWPAVRLAAKRRDGFRCAKCGARGRLEVHHEIPASKAPERAYDTSNLVTLCRNCHLRHHSTGMSPQRLAWAALLKEGLRNA